MDRDHLVKPCVSDSGRHAWGRRRDGSSFCRDCGETTDGLWASVMPIAVEVATPTYSKTDLRFLRCMRISPN